MQAYACRCTVGRMEPHRPDTLGPGTSGEADDPQLEAARAEFPDWEITRHWHGYEAVPKGTPVHRSMFLDGLLEKLRAWGAGGERPVAS
jgi:hypothetical protein